MAFLGDTGRGSLAPACDNCERFNTFNSGHDRTRDKAGVDANVFGFGCEFFYS